MITALLVGTAALVSLIVALVASWLARSAGMIIQKAIMCGGGALGATMTLLVVVLTSCALDVISELLMGMAALVSLIVALVASWLARSAGMIIQKAIMCGGGAFDASLTLLVVVLNAWALLVQHL